MPTLGAKPNTITLIPMVSIEEIITSRVPKTATRISSKKPLHEPKSPTRRSNRESQVCLSTHMSNAHNSISPSPSARLSPRKLSPKKPAFTFSKIAQKIAKKWTAKSRVFTAADAKKRAAARQDVLEPIERSPGQSLAKFQEAG